MNTNKLWNQQLKIVHWSWTLKNAHVMRKLTGIIDKIPYIWENLPNDHVMNGNEVHTHNQTYINSGKLNVYYSMINYQVINTTTRGRKLPVRDESSSPISTGTQLPKEKSQPGSILSLGKEAKRQSDSVWGGDPAVAGTAVSFRYDGYWWPGFQVSADVGVGPITPTWQFEGQDLHKVCGLTYHHPIYWYNQGYKVAELSQAWVHIFSLLPFPVMQHYADYA